MRQFFITLLASLTAFILFGFLLFGVFFMIAVIAIPDEKVTVAPNSILHIQLKRPLSERSIDNPLAELFDEGGSNEGVIDMMRAIKKAKGDDNIKGIFLDVRYIAGGFASIEELRNALIDFKSSKKFIYAYGEFFDEKAYYLVSVADKIFLNPGGIVELNGLTAERTFFKGMFEKLEIKPEIFRVGEYKSAVEPLFLEKMSDANRKQTESYLNSLYDHYLKNVAKAQKMDLKNLTILSDSMRVQNAEDALKYKLVSQLAYYDEVETALKEKIKIDKEDKISFLKMSKYIKTLPESDGDYDNENKIAVIVAEGEITTGEGDENTIGSERIAREIRKARKDKNVKAIVLRVNSPGGSALASDIIWREVVLAKKDKIVVASMSDYAASGGYYIAMAAHKIVALPNTITGSIGIFGVLLNTENFFKNKLGITTDRVSTGAYSDLGNPNRTMSDAERRMIQNMVNEGYEEFTSKAAQGRKMSIEALKKIASGRVWTGAEAKEIGLIDEFGGLEAAIVLAAKEAKLKEGDYRVKYLPTQEEFFEKVLKSLQETRTENIMQRELGELYPYFVMMKSMQKLDKLQARMPFDLQIK